MNINDLSTLKNNKNNNILLPIIKIKIIIMIHFQ